MFDLNTIVRENIRNLVPYSSARDEYSGKDAFFFDANENPYPTGYNRYPDPYQNELKQKLAKIKRIPAENIFLGNGSDEAIDLVFRAFCEPKTDNVIILPPTYGMYEVSANINNVKIVKVPLLKSNHDYSIDIQGIKQAIDEQTKMIFVCNPNNPTSNSFPHSAMIEILKNFCGIVVVDEAYIDFSLQHSMLQFLPEYPNLIVLQTFSKAWGYAGIRLGMAYSSEEIIKILSKIKAPYNVNKLTQEFALTALDNVFQKEMRVTEIVEQRFWLEAKLIEIEAVIRIYPSDSNFLLVETIAAKQIYNYLIDKNIVVRDRSSVTLCEGCLRITVGTPTENQMLVEALKQFKIMPLE